MRQAAKNFVLLTTAGLTLLTGSLALADSGRTGPAQSNPEQIQSWQKVGSTEISFQPIDPLTIVPLKRAGKINVTGGYVWPQAAVNLPKSDHIDTEALWSTPPVVPLPPAVWGGLIAIGGIAIRTVRKQIRQRSSARLF